MTLQIVLASGSESRRSLLAGAGVQAKSVRPNVDEEMARAAFRQDGLKIRDQAMRLAELKAQKVSLREQGLVIGGDQMLNLEETAFDKPKDLADARNHLVEMSGKTHVLETALVVYENGQSVWRHLARPKLSMRTLSPEFIDNYIAETGEDILSTVGAYKLEALGAQLFSRIEGDYFSILGLPLFPLLDYLRERGVLLK
jgi:septum formation protein